MSLTPTLAEIRFGKVDTKSSSKLVLPGTITVAQNVQMTTTGRYQRRPGSTLLTTVSGANVIHDHANETLIGTTDTLYSRYASANNSRGVLTSFDTRHTPVNNTPFSQTGHDMVVTNSQEWSTWVDGRGGIKYSVKDVTTGAYVVSEGTVTSAIDRYSPRIFALSAGYVLITYLQVDSGLAVTLAGKRISVSAPTSLGGEVNIDTQVKTGGSGLDTYSGYDGAVVSSTEVHFVYFAANGGVLTDERVRIKKWNVSTMTTTTTLTESADRGPGIGGVGFLSSGTAPGLYVAHSRGDTGNDVRLLIAASDLSSFTTTATLKSYGAPTTLMGTTGWVDSITGTQHVLAERMATSGATTRPVLDYFTRTSGGSVTEVGTYYGFSLASQPFVSSSVYYVVVQAPNAQPAASAGAVNTRSSYYVMACTTGTLAGKVLADVGEVDNPVAYGTGRVLPVVQTTSTGFAVALGYNSTPVLLSAAIGYFDPSARKRWVEAGGVTVIPGSWPRIYDGLGVTELGFGSPPNIVNSAQSGASGLANGTYYYRLTWYWVDATGREHESEPCAEYSFTVSGGPRIVTLTVETLTATLKKSPSQGALLRVYRTTGGASAADANFYLTGTVANSTTATTVSFADSMADATLITQERLYTFGQTVLENTPPSPTTAMLAWGGRLWSIDGNTLNFSKLVKDDFGIASNDTLFITKDDQYGDLVALADGGSRLYAFKRGAIYYATGDGPDDLGAGNFPAVDRLDLPLGARSQFSVVATEVGIFFQDDATSQIWLLGDNGAEYVGAPIETILASATIVDAVQVGRQVRFFTANGSPSTFVYDLYHRQWTWSTGQAATGAGVINGVCHRIGSNGTIVYDDATAWTEAGTSYQAVLEIAWVSLAGLSGFQRVYKILALGEALGAHTLSVVSTYKFGTQTATKTVASAALSTTHGYRVLTPVRLAHQQSTSIKIRLEDNSPATAGFGIEALGLEVGIERRAARLPAVNRTS